MRLMWIFVLSSATVFSQDRISMELGIGHLLNETRENIVNHMKAIHYNQYVIDYDYLVIFQLDSSSSHIEHPKNRGFSSSMYGNLLYDLNEKHKVGIKLQYDQYGSVIGNNKNFEEYSVGIRAIKLFPMYKLELSRYFAITIATGMIVNSSRGHFLTYTGNNTTSSQFSPIDETKRRIGTGIDLSFALQFPFKRFYIFLGGNGSVQTSFQTGTLNSSSLYPFQSLKLNNSNFGVNMGIGVTL